MNVLEAFEQHPLLRNVAVSLLALGAVLVGRWLSLRWLRGQNMPTDSHLRWRAQVRNATVLFVLLGLTIVWAEELRAVAISVVALAAALVIGMKELIMCLTGSLLRASAQQFQIGDRVEIAGYRGDVIDIGPLTTSLLEVGPGAMIHQRSGRVVTLPNSVFLVGPVINETITHEFVLHVVRVPLRRDEDWKAARERLLALAHEVAGKHIADAGQSMTRIAMQRGLSAASVKPSVYIELTKPDELELLLRFPAPAAERGKLAQQILTRYLDDGGSP